MPDRDVSYIDDELAANDEFITWMGSGDSADSSEVDPRLDDDATGEFDYYADPFAVLAARRRSDRVRLDEIVSFDARAASGMVRPWGGETFTWSLPAGSVDENVVRAMFGLPPRTPEPNFDCPVIPGPTDQVELLAHRTGMDGYAARAELDGLVTRALAGLTRYFDRLTEVIRPAALTMGQLAALWSTPRLGGRATGRQHSLDMFHAMTAAARMPVLPRIPTTAEGETARDRALRLRRDRNTGPAQPGMDGRRRRC